MWNLLQSAISGLAILPILGALATIILLWLVGRLLVGRDLPALVAFGAGWGLAVTAMTVLGTRGSGSLAWLPWALWGLAAGSLVLEARYRRWPSAWMALVLTLPLALLISGRIASEWDEFSHWLHAFRYLDAYQTLPGKGRPSIESCCAAYPYGWPLLGWLPSRLIGFSESVPGLLNLFQLALCGDLLARIVAKNENPRWGHQAWGVLLVTLLGTTFVPKLVFTAYADVPTAAMMLAMVWCGWRLTENGGWRLVLALALCGVVLVTQKPSNLVLVVLAFGGVGLTALTGEWRALPRKLGLVLLSAIPVFAVWWLWRSYVGSNLAGEEMYLRPFSQWYVENLGVVAKGMAEVASNKGGYFGIMLAACVVGAISLFRSWGENGRLVRLVALVFLGYNSFLMLAYIAIFQKGEGEQVASYWRYNTHLGLLTALFAALALAWVSGRWRFARAAGGLKVLGLAVMVAGPVAGIKHIRFDLEPGKLFLRGVLQAVNDQELPGVALIDAKGSGLSHVMASYEWDGSPRLKTYTTGFDDFTPDAYLRKVESASHVLVVSWSDAVAQAFPTLPPGPHAVLAERAGGKVLQVFPYLEGVESKPFP